MLTGYRILERHETLERRVTGIDGEDTAGHALGLVGCEESGEISNILGLQYAHEVQILDLLALDGIAHERRLVRRFDEARADGVYPHPVRREARRQRARHGDDTTLGGRVAVDAGLTDERIGRRGQNDRARALLKHLPADIFAA